MDYIIREDAIDALIRHSMHISNTWQTDYRGEVAGIDMAICIIEDLPAADVPERNVGKWLDEYDEKIGYIAKCSACGEKILYGVSFDFEGNRHQMNFCPNCGAKMEG